MYEFGTEAGSVRRALVTDAATSFTFKGLPVGLTTLYVCAVSSMGALLATGAACPPQPLSSLQHVLSFTRACGWNG